MGGGSSIRYSIENIDINSVFGKYKVNTMKYDISKYLQYVTGDFFLFKLQTLLPKIGPKSKNRLWSIFIFPSYSVKFMRDFSFKK